MAWGFTLIVRTLHELKIPKPFKRAQILCLARYSLYFYLTVTF
jgi:hypothetical protein